MSEKRKDWNDERQIASAFKEVVDALKISMFDLFDSVLIPSNITLSSNESLNMSSFPNAPKLRQTFMRINKLI